MFKSGKNKLWIENPGNLVSSVSIIPMNGMTVAEQMNAISRFVILTFIILVLFNFKYSVIFLLISFLLIIILYYIQRMTSRSKNIEYFTKPENKQRPKTNKPPIVNMQNKLYAEDCIFCDDTEIIENNFNDPQYVSPNQKLAGGPNPKTLIAPVIAPPISDLSYWRANNLVTHSAVNENLQDPVYQSGYVISEDCTQKPPYVRKDPLQFLRSENYTKRKSSGSMEMPYLKNQDSVQIIEDVHSSAGPIVENYEGLIGREKGLNGDTEVLPNQSGWVNTACGYNPKQLLNAGLPTNLATGICQQDPSMEKYNTDLFTQTIQPGVYTSNQINEQLNSNLGISFTQQFPPVSCTEDSQGVSYIQRDPRLVTEGEEISVVCPPSIATESNVYDPRHTGYGTGYRAYTDEMLGQTKFYYDDVDAIRMPNYLVRSNIDTQSFADRYGPIPGGDENGNKFTRDIRTLADTAFLNDSLQHRNDIQERVSRNINRKMWQRRKAPLGPSRGGCGSRISF